MFSVLSVHLFTKEPTCRGVLAQGPLFILRRTTQEGAAPPSSTVGRTEMGEHTVQYMCETVEYTVQYMSETVGHTV